MILFIIYITGYILAYFLSRNRDKKMKEYKYSYKNDIVNFTISLFSWIIVIILLGECIEKKIKKWNID